MSGESTKGFLNPQEVHDRLGITPGMKVADFGCGAGEFAILMARAVGPDGVVTAIDVLTTALESVQARAKANGLGNLQTLRGNLEILGGSKLSDGSQDVVLAANILIQSDKQTEILSEAKRILKPGGMFAAVEWKKGVPGFGPPDASRIDSAALEQLLAGQGFIIVSKFDAGGYHYGIIARRT